MPSIILRVGSMLIALACVACKTPSVALDAGDGDAAEAREASVATSPTQAPSAEPARVAITPHEPKKHRARAATCTLPRAVSRASSFPKYQHDGCKSDAECKEGKNGRCHSSRRGMQCNYDECVKDDQCVYSFDPKSKGACECRTQESLDQPNYCRLGNCRIDADCTGASPYCSPSSSMCHGTDGYYCHTPSDECIDDVECHHDSSTNYSRCLYNPSAGRWQCLMDSCAG